MTTDTQRAAAEALQTLTPHKSNPSIAALIETLKGLAGGEGESEGGLEKAMAEVQTHRVAIAKAEGISKSERFELTQQLDKADRAIQHSYMLRKSSGYARSHAQREAERERRAATMGRRV